MVLISDSSSKAPSHLLKYDGRLYKKVIGRAYRTYWKCIEKACNGQLLVNELKGGSISTHVKHATNCAAVKY